MLSRRCPEAINEGREGSIRGEGEGERYDLKDKALAAYRSAKKERPKEPLRLGRGGDELWGPRLDTNPPRNVTFYLVTRFPR